MSVTQLFQRKLKLEMKLIHIIDKKPKMVVKLDPIDSEDFIISLEAVRQWSDNNEQLYEAILENGMAEHICNREYLFEFYRHLAFNSEQITTIDDNCLRYRNLSVLSLMQNRIQTIQHIPPNCRELYLDFNLISSVRLKNKHSLELLSISNNIITDESLPKITHSFPELRCLNLSWNRIANLKQFVVELSTLSKLKVLVCYANPISMLAIYYSYITDHIQVAYIDGSKYVKQEEVKKEELKVEEKKEVKEQKKDSKKDTKKGGKAVVEEKPIEQAPKPEPPKQVPKRQLTREDFEQIKLNIKISNLQRFAGNNYDPSLFPTDTDASKIQTTYWVKYYLLEEEVQQKAKIVNFDSATVQNDEIRLNLQLEVSKTVELSYSNFIKFNKGVRIQVWQSEPKMIKDSETLQLKPEIKDGQIVSNVTILGATHFDLRKLHLSNKKEHKVKSLLFDVEAVRSPLFYDPYEDEKDIVAKRKENFESKLKKAEEERLKKMEEQELLKQQKKGGKEVKKGGDKKAVGKKDGKEVVVLKRKSQKCDFSVQQRQYCIVNEEIFKGKELLCLQVSIQ